MREFPRVLLLRGINVSEMLQALDAVGEEHEAYLFGYAQFIP